jgi:hypothetical protein
VPFKQHSKGRRHIPRQRHRVTYWRDYDAALRNRGSLTVWFSEEALAGWRAASKDAGRSGSLFEPRYHLTSARTHRSFRASALQTWREVVAAA